ncbi:hypothetical protein AB0M58_37895 [Streptomyces bobili]|uniref:hypothetical protein n=1 Tax=Streptomyces bobili TaxID=67280 RepID=UPI0034344B6E
MRAHHARAAKALDGDTESGGEFWSWAGALPGTAARVRVAFPVLGSPAGLAAEGTVCAQLLQTVARGDNLVLEDQLRN